MTTPLVAQRRRDEVLAAFRKKNQVLRDVVQRKRADTLPNQLSNAAYCDWESPIEGVNQFSTSTFYNRKYDAERAAAKLDLEALEAIRRAAKAKKKSKGITVDNIKIELQTERLRSREFANQYNEQVKLTEALSRRVDELEQALSRAKKDLSKIQPLRGIGQHGR